MVAYNGVRVSVLPNIGRLKKKHYHCKNNPFITNLTLLIHTGLTLSYTSLKPTKTVGPSVGHMEIWNYRNQQVANVKESCLEFDWCFWPAHPSVSVPLCDRPEAISRGGSSLASGSASHCTTGHWNAQSSPFTSAVRDRQGEHRRYQRLRRENWGLTLTHPCFPELVSDTATVKYVYFVKQFKL